MDSLPRRNYRRTECFPKLGRQYTLADLLEVIHVEMNVREFMDERDEVEIEQCLNSLSDGTFYRFKLKDQVRMIICKKGKDCFEIDALFGVFPVNARAICSDPSASEQGLGRGFMALGGNSYVTSGFRF